MSCSKHPQSVSPYQSTEKKSRCGGNGQKMCAKKSKWVKQGEHSNARSPMHQNLLSNNNDAQSTTKYGFLLRPHTQIVALRAHCTRTALKAPPQNQKIHWGMVLLGKIMILQGVRHPISCLGVCYANDPPKGGYATPVPALDLTTSLRGDFSMFCRSSMPVRGISSRGIEARSNLAPHLGQVVASRAHCVHTVHAEAGIPTQEYLYLTGCTAKQQSPHENDETTFNLVLRCPYEQTTQPCKVRLLRVFQCLWLRSWRRR